jgi:predicted transcriptional regulator
MVQPQQSLNDVLPLMAGRDINQLPVVENGVVVGILSRDAILRHLAVRHGLGLDADEGHVEKRLADAA